MDPLYANLDKRNSSASQSKTPTPQPSTNPMPDFGQPSTPESSRQASDSTSNAPVSQTITSNLTTPTQPIVSSSDTLTKAQPIMSTPIVSGPAPSTSKSSAVGSGDIILNIDQPKKSKKGLIIFFVVTLLVFSAVGIGIWLHSQQNNGEQQASLALYNKYVNYILFEKESDEKLNNFESFAFSKINQFAQSDEIEAKQDFIDHAKSIYDDFAKTFQSDDTSISGAVKNVAIQLSNLSQYFAAENISELEEINSAKINEIVVLKEIIEDEDKQPIDVLDAKSKVYSLEYELFNNLYRSSHNVYNLIYNSGVVE